MTRKVCFVERKFWGFVSIEKIFAVVADFLNKESFQAQFIKAPFDNNLTGILKNLLYFRPAAADIYHITGHIHYMALVLPPERTVLTIHDLGILRLRRGLRRFVLKKLLIDWPVKRLRYITAVSEKSRDEILELSNCDPAKIRVIWNPVQPQFFDGIERPFDTMSPVVLQVGSLPHKNVANLARALTGVACTLRIVGETDDELRRVLEECRVTYETVSGLDDEAMRAAYGNADIVAFCSTYEGFGMPIIEAQAMGRPVMTSDLSPMREVAGDGAMLVDPFDPQDIRRGFLKIRDDAEYRRQLVEKGVENVRRFHPASITKQYEELYDQVLHQVEARN